MPTLFSVSRLMTAVLVLSLVSCEEEVAEDPEHLSNEPVDVEILREIVPAPDTRFPEEDSALDDVQVSADGLVLTYTGEPEIELEPGHVVVGAQGGGYLCLFSTSIRVTSPISPG